MEGLVNMNKKKLFLILFLLIFVTGCGNISYNLDIRRNNTYESLNMELNDSYQILELKNIVEENINSYPTSTTKNVSYEVDSNKVNIFNSFDSIYNLSDNEIINRFYDKVNISVEDNITSVIFTSYNTSSFECGEFDEGCLLVLDKVTVNLTSEYEIIDNNADFVDKKHNKYTWILDSESDDIYFSYSDKVLWNIVIKNYLKEHYDLMILTIICIVALFGGTIILIKFLKSMKENNS